MPCRSTHSHCMSNKHCSSQQLRNAAFFFLSLGITTKSRKKRPRGAKRQTTDDLLRILGQFS